MMSCVKCYVAPCAVQTFFAELSYPQAQAQGIKRKIASLSQVNQF